MQPDIVQSHLAGRAGCTNTRQFAGLQPLRLSFYRIQHLNPIVKRRCQVILFNQKQSSDCLPRRGFCPSVARREVLLYKNNTESSDVILILLFQGTKQIAKNSKGSISLHPGISAGRRLPMRAACSVPSSDSWAGRESQL